MRNTTKPLQRTPDQQHLKEKDPLQESSVLAPSASYQQLWQISSLVAPLVSVRF